MTDNRRSRSSTRKAPPREEPDMSQPAPRRRTTQRQGVLEAVIKSFVRTLGSTIGRIIVRAITGGRR